MFFDPLYFIILAPALLFAGYASFLTRSRFAKYSRIPTRGHLTGAQAAHRLLLQNGINDVTIEPTRGFLGDHYDPAARTLRLSPEVYGSNSMAAIGVACHEAGHAIQHAEHYLPLHLRSTLVPACNIGSQLSMPILMIGMLMSAGTRSGIGYPLMLAGIGLFALTVIFSLITLPVEYDASARAKRLMVSSGIVSPSESEDAGKVLDAAFLTYLAAAFSAVLTLLYYLFRAGLLGGSRRD